MSEVAGCGDVESLFVSLFSLFRGPGRLLMCSVSGLARMMDGSGGSLLSLARARGRSVGG